MTIYLSWRDYNKITEKIADELKSQEFDQIVGISRSGLICAVHLSHLLGIRQFGCVGVNRTTEDKQNARKQPATIHYTGNINNISGKQVLVVDDIIGEGNTLDIVRKMLLKKGAHVTAAILMANLDNYKGDNIDEIAEIIGEKVNGWVVFPWCEYSATCTVFRKTLKTG